MTQVIVPPDIDDRDLLFDDQETREVLGFFWPDQAKAIDGLAVTTEMKRFAQSLFIAAVDTSYAMGHIDILLRTEANARGGLKLIGRKFLAHPVPHWWNHAKPHDLQDVKVYESVRSTVANHLSGAFQALILRGSARVNLAPFFWSARRSSQVWV